MNPLRKPRILIIDDEPLIASLIARMMGRTYDVSGLTQGKAGLKALTTPDHVPYDLVLCDLMMPDMTGMEVHAELVRLGSPYADTMIFLTGGVFVGEAGRFLSDVRNRCIEKPFTAAEMRKAVSQAVGMPEDTQQNPA